MNLAGKAFRAVTNSANGSLNGETVMHFLSDDGANEGIVTGHYAGGTIRAGQVLARRINDSELEMLYQGATTAGAIQSGKARAVFTTGEDGKRRMSLQWQWFTGDQSAGHSEWVELSS
jgi:hypothetical protein